MEKFISALDECKPGYIQGYVGALAEVANFMSHNSFHLKVPRAVWATAAPLPQTTRKAIETTFGAPCFDQYGSCEVFSIAAECRAQDGLHVFQDARHIDFIGDPTPDGAQDILVTDLRNFAFPIIRYRNGDQSSWRTKAPCTCGVAFPRMNPIRGRVSENIRLSNGVIFTGETLTTIFDDHVDAVRAFQVVETSQDRLLIRYVSAADSPAQVFRAVAEQLRSLSRGVVTVEFERVTTIKQDSGKTRYVIARAQSNSEGPST